MITDLAKSVPFPYLDKQFLEVEEILDKIRKVISSGDFTLGEELTNFEKEFAACVGVNYAIGVNSGTDALKLSLRSLGVGPGDEVITNANTFVATVGAIIEVGATPVFVDCNKSICIDESKIEAAITNNTKAIIPVHLSGAMCNMKEIMSLAESYNLKVIEDACQAFMSSFEGKKAGSFGDLAAFSLHPMKFVNIWGDGGVIVTNNKNYAEQLRLMRNHGLKDRDTIVMAGYNSRLDTIQAVVAQHLLNKKDEILLKRNKNALRYDNALSKIAELEIPMRNSSVVHSFVTYQVFCEERDELLNHCQINGVDCKIHYPMPIYLQPGFRDLGYKKGDFPEADRQAAMSMTLPVNQYIDTIQIDYAISTIKDFYKKWHKA